MLQALQDDCSQVTEKATLEKEQLNTELARLTSLVHSFHQQIQSYLPIPRLTKAEEGRRSQSAAPSDTEQDTP